MQLNRLPRGRANGAVAVIAHDLVEGEPLLGRAHPTRYAHAKHEGERLLHLLARALAAEIAVVLKIHAVELHELSIVLDDRTGDVLTQAFGEGAAQVLTRFLDVFVARKVSSHGFVLLSWTMGRLKNPQVVIPGAHRRRV